MNKTEQYIPVSAVITAYLCPMRFYLDSRSGETGQESLRYTVCKQVSAHLGNTIDTARIWDEVCGMVPGADPDLRGFMEDCIDRCNAGGPWHGFGNSDVYLQSKKYGISGNIDKLHDREPHLSVVRAVSAPPSGMYASDRLRVFGYMLLVKEELGTEIPGGMVEYIPSGVARYCVPRPIDKRRFFRALNDAKNILAGEAPPRPDGVRCRSCESLDACRPAGRRLSDIL